MGLNNIKNQLTYLLSAMVPKDKQMWAFGGWMGERYGDNTGAFLQYMAFCHPENKYFWFSNHPEDVEGLIPENVSVVKRNSKEGKRILKKSKFKVMCQGAEDLDSTNLLGGSVNIQLWHGVAWKKIGIDCFSRKKSIVGRLKYTNYVWAHSLQHGGDLFIAPSDAYATVLQSAFLIERSKIINVGYPRNCILFDKKQYKDKRKEILDKLNLDQDVKVVLYMPTFRDKGMKRFSFWDNLNNTESFKNTVVFEKGHFIEKGEQKTKSDRNNVYDVKAFDSQELLLISDLLITDYSSCFFDYLLLDRPIIQFIYDFEYYRDKDRGVYYSDEEMDCGYIARTDEEMFSLLHEFDSKGLECTGKQLKVKERFMTYERPDNCETLYKEIEHRFLSGKNMSNASANQTFDRGI